MAPYHHGSAVTVVERKEAVRGGSDDRLARGRHVDGVDV